MIEFDKSRVRILIVDDEDSIRNMLGISLKEDGWNVELAANGKLGLEALEKCPFHIVISDIQMPEMSGIDFLAATKAKYPNVEFIIMTSNASLETAMQAIKLGAYDYVTKPFENLSVVSKKMTQVSEKILLRQQNAEFTRRLRKASQDLKLLFSMTSQMNGVLDEKALREIVMQWPPKLFQDPQVAAFWFQNDDQSWKLVDEIGPKTLIKMEDSLTSLDVIRGKTSSLRSPKEILLKHEGQSDRLLVFEGLSPDLAELFSHEVRTCFEKVMRYQYMLSLANRDGLTRLYNHRYFQDRLRQEMSQVKRQNADLSLVLTDVDHFKSFNDTRGHPAGDQLLRELALVFDRESNRRDSDVVARYGGEEFVFLLPFTDYQGALVKAERIRAAVEQTVFLSDSGTPAKVTITLGVATFPMHAVSASNLIELADKALYQGKAAGRNRVMGYESVKKTPAPASDVPKPTLATVLSEPEALAGADSVVPSSPEAPALQEPLIPETPKVTSELPQTKSAPATDLQTPPPDLPQDEVKSLLEAFTAKASVEVAATAEAARNSAVDAPKIVNAPPPLQPEPEVKAIAATETLAAKTSEVETHTEVSSIEASPPATPLAASESGTSKAKFKRRSLGPEVDVDDLYNSLEGAFDRPTESDGDLKTVLFKTEEESNKKPPKGNHGTGTQG